MQPDTWRDRHEYHPGSAVAAIDLRASLVACCHPGAHHPERNTPMKLALTSAEIDEITSALEDAASTMPGTARAAPLHELQEAL